MSAVFVLKCVGCATVEKRNAEDCSEMQYCNKCGLPMVLEEVIAKGVIN